MKRFFKKLTLFYRYSVSAVVSFGLELATLYIFVGLFELSYIVSVPSAFALTTVAQYIICHWWVFNRSGRSIPFEYTYFTVILFSGMLWTLVLVALLVQTFEFNVYLARIFAGVFTGFWNFYLNARFNFRAHPFLR